VGRTKAMKISDMTNDQATDAMIRISAALGFICEDQEIVGLIDEMQNMGDMPIMVAIPKILPKFTSLAFRRHKDSLYEIIGALCQKPKKDIGKMNFKETIALVKESYDDILRDFFTSSVPSQKRSGEESV
jgi:hypothetical protein